MILGTLVGTAPPASAAPVSFCSDWNQWETFRIRACVIISPSDPRVAHVNEIQYLGSGVATAAQATWYWINGATDKCAGGGAYVFLSGQQRRFGCYTTRVAGYQYRTTASISNVNGSYGAFAQSPTATP